MSGEKKKASEILAGFSTAEQDATLRESLSRSYRQLKQAKDSRAAYIQAAYEGARDAIREAGPIPPVPEPKLPRRRRGREEAALIHSTDWQGGKETPTYNTKVMRARVHQTFDKAFHLTDIQRTDHDVDHAVIAFGGDMLEGLMNFPTQVFEVDATIFDQWKNVGLLCVEVVRRALAKFKTVEVVSEWGNHGRIGSKRDAIPRADNLDRMAYELARQILATDISIGKRLVWRDSIEDIQRIEIGEYRALLIHGDEMGRNGYSSPPAIARWANDQRSGSYPWPFRDVFVGHYHFSGEVPMANGHGTIFFTGSTESGSRYATDGMARGSVPTQRMHFIDPIRGRVTSRYTIYLD